MAKLLTSIGIPCGHERVFGPHGMDRAAKVLETGGQNSRVAVVSGLHSPGLTYHLRAESSYMAAPFLNESCVQEATIIHVVRNPLHVLNSFLNNLQYFRWRHGPRSEYEKFICAHVPTVAEQKTPASRACEYWIRWNQMIEAAQTRPYLRVRVEDGPDEVMAFLKIPDRMRAKALRGEHSNSFTSWPAAMQPRANQSERVSAADLFACPLGGALAEMTTRYGYDVPSGG